MMAMLNNVIESIQHSELAFYRYITANDTGATGAHQAGFYIPKCAACLLFDTLGVKGGNKSRYVKIKWQDDFETDSRFIYYGSGTRNEYRITRFGRNFPFFSDDNIGDLLVLVKLNEDEYRGYVLETSEEIEAFFSYFNLSPDSSNQLIQTQRTITPDERILQLYQEFVERYATFPETRIMADGARQCYETAYSRSVEEKLSNPDKVLLDWIHSEYELFRLFEDKIYSFVRTTPFPSIDAFVRSANEILNRRKARAGKSLEHHLASLFHSNELVFEEQAVTEMNKKPDFLFPGGEFYNNMIFPIDGITVLGAKTTCKDRWRQIISEANRVDEKYLFTLQPGISSNQLREMEEARVKLVVPQTHIEYFPVEYREKIGSLKNFISMVKSKQDNIYKRFITI